MYQNLAGIFFNISMNSFQILAFILSKIIEFVTFLSTLVLTFYLSKILCVLNPSKASKSLINLKHVYGH